MKKLIDGLQPKCPAPFFLIGFETESVTGLAKALVEAEKHVPFGYELDGVKLPSRRSRSSYGEFKFKAKER